MKGGVVMRKSILFGVLLSLGLIAKAHAGMYYLKLQATRAITCNYQGWEDNVTEDICTADSYCRQVNQWQTKNPNKEITKLDPVTRK